MCDSSVLEKIFFLRDGSILKWYMTFFCVCGSLVRCACCDMTVNSGRQICCLLSSSGETKAAWVNPDRKIQRKDLTVGCEVLSTCILASSLVVYWFYSSLEIIDKSQEGSSATWARQLVQTSCPDEAGKNLYEIWVSYSVMASSTSVDIYILWNCPLARKVSLFVIIFCLTGR